MSNKDFNIVEGVLIEYTGTDKNVVIPDGVLVIDKFAFPRDITSVVIPNSVLAINKYAFSGCKCLKNVDIPDSVTSICESAFKECTGLTSVKFGKGIKKIGEFAFYKCTNLKEVTIESGKIEEYAFADCTGLEKVVLGCAKIKDSVFGSSKEGKINELFVRKTVKKIPQSVLLEFENIYFEADEKKAKSTIKKTKFGGIMQDYYNSYLKTEANIHWGADISKI